MLSAIIWLPLLGAIWIGILPRFSRSIALITVGVTLMLAIAIATMFNYQDVGLQFVEHIVWVEPLGLDYQLGIDGLSLPLIILNSLLVVLSVQATAKDVERPRLFHALLLLVSTAITGAFLAQNLLLFFLFYELELIPLYLLIAIWGGEKRGYAATKFLIYQALSGIILLAGFLSWAWFAKTGDFNYESLAATHLPANLQLLFLSIILLGFGIKMPLVPFHTWLPDAYVEASTPVSMLLGGIVSKLGTYGLIRFGLGLFPDAWAIVAPWLALIAVFTAVYGSTIAIAQTDIKKTIAYSSVAHLSYVLLATAAGTPLSLLGAVYQMVAHGLILALLFNLVGIIEAKTGTRELNQLHGLLNPQRGLPFVGAMLILTMMASAGIPGMAGFIGEFLSFQGSYAAFPIGTLICLASTGLTSVYFIIIINRALFGKLTQDLIYLPKVASYERVPAIVLAALIILLGVRPNILISHTQVTTDEFVATLPSATTQIAKLEVKNPLPGAKSAVLGFPQVKHLFKTGVPVGRGG
ncbi:NADH-quinone oxidoreductase subunit M [Chamaesiphon sp. OTE_20_metabat_361]|uniref:NADH-quinone oxidoreductase subunit M n=1 Tax=Chamaesiphon sp. OTE_20_metabat_361 TaxID=2964689 RepID=UPI00286BD4B2|nr:NADH-quinone oxidoreductase subunit M [Chamaesiphon sp. OTE_20_metabat_361]